MSDVALQIAEKRREAKGKGQKERYLFECRDPKKSKESKKAFLIDQCKEIEGKKIEWERLEISSRKLEIPREHFMPRWAQ